LRTKNELRKIEKEINYEKFKQSENNRNII